MVKKYCTSNFHSSPTYRLQTLCKFIGYCYLANFALWHYRLPVHSAGRSFDSCDLFLPLEQLLPCLQKLRCTYGTTDYRSCYMKKCLLSDTIILLCVFMIFTNSSTIIANLRNNIYFVVNALHLAGCTYTLLLTLVL